MSVTVPNELTQIIVAATRAAVSDLFRDHPGQYYYLSLITTGAAHAPFLAAWSKEALDQAVSGSHDPDDARRGIKWSYADSPFMEFGKQHFAEVYRRFLERGEMPEDDAAYDAEYECRLGAMEASVAQLDREGLFGAGDERNAIVVNVEVMPPDRTNTERAKRLNPPAALGEWLQEAAE